jgi:Rieske 2Fe-2S family protein
MTMFMAAATCRPWVLQKLLGGEGMVLVEEKQGRPGTPAHIAALVASRREGYGLPRPFYHDEALYEYELASIWRRDWLFAGYTCQLPHSGDYFTYTVDTDPLVVLRDEAGEIRAFHNICTHRGTLLCQKETGQGRAIVCPYHQWTFSLQGDLISCVGMQPDIEKSDLSLRPVHVACVEGMIFISLNPTPPPFEPARDLWGAYAPPQGFPRAKVAAIAEYTIGANWKVVWENNRECYHCTVNHPQYIKSNFDIYEDGHGSVRIQEKLAAAVARSEATWKLEGIAVSHRQGGLAEFPDAEHNIWYSATRTVLAEGYESESMDGQRVAPLMGDYPDANVGVLRLRALPNFWNHSSCDHGVTTRLTPRGPRQTQARVYWLVHEEAREGIDYQLETLKPFWQLTSEQDWELCERVQIGVTSSAYQPGPLSKGREYNLDAFIRWYLRQL